MEHTFPHLLAPPTAGRTGPLRMVGQPTEVPGYAYGARQPSLMFRLALVRPLRVERLEAADLALGAACGQGIFSTGAAGNPQPLDLLLSWIRRILEKHDHPVLEAAKVFVDGRAGQQSASILQPCLDPHACVAAVELSLELMAWAEESREPLVDMARAALERRQTMLGRGRLIGFNSVHFLRAAAELKVPWLRLPDGVFQFGMGASSRLLRSSLTDRTSQIAAATVRHKAAAGNLLRSAGIPVPLHELVTSDDDAVAAAQAMGYPVVVKPADTDGGLAVSCSLTDAAAVRHAYALARSHSQQVLVERHVPGADYRIHVVDGVVLGVLERTPGGVTGDGRRSVRDLVESENEARATALDDRRFLHPIMRDDEARSFLHAAGMDWDSVPPAGIFVRLRSAANVASGGVPRPVPLEEVHPDNVELALRAVRVLRLDVAGVDLLMPDIRQSWFTCGAAICEVNAQPQMFTTLHVPMLRSLLGDGSGRIPSVLVIAAGRHQAACEALHERLRRQFPAAGLAAEGGCRIGERPAFEHMNGCFTTTRALLVDPAVQALVIGADSEVLTRGWPIDRCDAIVLAGDWPAPGPAAPASVHARLCKAAVPLRPRAVFAAASSGECVSQAAAAGLTVTHLVDSQAGDGRGLDLLADTVATWLLKDR